ncbi:hypothetical protein MTO96_021016 [Rhipicephalus appendiculatus]
MHHSTECLFSRSHIGAHRVRSAIDDKLFDLPNEFSHFGLVHINQWCLVGVRCAPAQRRALQLLFTDWVEPTHAKRQKVHGPLTSQRPGRGYLGAFHRRTPTPVVKITTTATTMQEDSDTSQATALPASTLRSATRRRATDKDTRNQLSAQCSLIVSKIDSRLSYSVLLLDESKLSLMRNQSKVIK